MQSRAPAQRCASCALTWRQREEQVQGPYHPRSYVLETVYLDTKRRTPLPLLSPLPLPEDSQEQQIAWFIWLVFFVCVELSWHDGETLGEWGERLKQTGLEKWKDVGSEGNYGRRMRTLLEVEASWRKQRVKGRLWLWDSRCFCNETVRLLYDSLHLPLKTWVKYQLSFLDV